MSKKIAYETLDFRAGERLDITKINKALKKFYSFEYFNDIKVEENEGRVTFVFEEKPSISNIQINGYKTKQSDLDEIYRQIGLKKGNFYSLGIEKEAKKKLLKILQDDGYINSVVEAEVNNINRQSVSIIFNVNEGDNIIIKKASYYGAKHLNAEDFDKVTANKQIQSFPWFFGRNDGKIHLNQLGYENYRINDLYYQNGYLDSTVSKPFMKIDFASDSANLSFFIKEGKRYTTSSIKILLPKKIKSKLNLQKGLQLKKNQYFDIKKLREDVKFIKTKIANLGYAFAEVKYDIKKDSKNHKVNVIFLTNLGKKVYIKDVIISGNSRTLDRVIRRNIYLAPGDLFSLSDLKQSTAKLRRTGFFKTVRIEQERLSENKMNLLVHVKEASTGKIVFGGGYGSYDGFLINASINDRDIFGSGLGLGFSIDYSDKENTYSLSLNNPAIRDSEYTGNFKIYNTDNEIDYDHYQLEKKTQGFSASAGKELIRNVYSGATYKLEQVKEDYVKDDDGYEGNMPVNTDYLLSSITPYINFDDTDNFFTPRHGMKAGTSLEYAGLGGQAKYLKSLNYFKFYYGLKKLVGMDLIFKYRLSVNMLFNEGYVSQGDTFYLGGPGSVRGYESYAFGPDYNTYDNDQPYKRFAANSFELSFPLVPAANLRWSIFYDLGMIGVNNFNQVKKAGTGIVVEWISPAGPMQLIFSKPLMAEAGDDTSHFTFNLGSKF